MRRSRRGWLSHVMGVIQPLASGLDLPSRVRTILYFSLGCCSLIWLCRVMLATIFLIPQWQQWSAWSTRAGIAFAPILHIPLREWNVCKANKLCRDFSSIPDEPRCFLNSTMALFAASAHSHLLHAMKTGSSILIPTALPLLETPQPQAIQRTVRAYR